MDFTHSKAVNIGTEANPIALKTLLDANVVKSITQYGTDRAEAISAAIASLISNKYGMVAVPSDSDLKNAFFIVARTNQLGEPVINIITSLYKYPTTEARPITIENSSDWEVGDVIYNTSFENNDCIGWICTATGTPGNWTPFGHLHPNQTDFELYASLPTPNANHSGHAILVGSVSTGYTLYYCIPYMNDEAVDYKWINAASGSSSSDNPITVATTVISGNNWRVTNLDGNSLPTTGNEFANNNTYNNKLILITAPSNSVDNQQVYFGATAYSISYLNGKTVNADNVVAGSKFLVIYNYKTQKIYLAGTGSSSISTENYNSKTTTFNDDGSITETSTLDGVETVKKTTFEGPKITEVTTSGSTTSTKITTFNDDGSISEVIS